MTEMIRLPEKGQHCVYYLRARQDGPVIYVGYTAHLSARMARHQSADGNYGRLISLYVEFDEFDNKRDALNAESHAIRRLRPSDNVIGNCA